MARLQPQTVVGVDPGLASLGLGAVMGTARTQSYLGSLLVTTCANQGLPARLLILRNAVRAFLEECQPDVLAVEAQYFHQQLGTAVKVGAAVGVVLLCAAESGIPVIEYGPKQVKQSVTGHGGASKRQVAYMVKAQLGLNTSSSHVSDALALALTHLQSSLVGRSP